MNKKNNFRLKSHNQKNLYGRVPDREGAHIFNIGYSKNFKESKIPELVNEKISTMDVELHKHTLMRIGDSYHGRYNREMTRDEILDVKNGKGKVVEVEADDFMDYLKIYKAVIRLPRPGNNDVVVVVTMDTPKAEIKTAWENAVDDNHSTLKKNGIEREVNKKIIV